VENSSEIIRTVLTAPETYAVCLKENGKPVGSIGFHRNDLAEADDEYELGYWIGKPFWNQGYCTEALRAMIDYCFNTKEFITLWADHFVDNPASGRVMNKCGFRDTERVNYLSELYKGDERPVKIMRLDYSL
jgi:RimJ/RimL family protein N-acetyltransferase